MLAEALPPRRPRNGSAATGARDPFAWREALSPGISPAASARSSHAGSVCSNRSTPREATPPSPVSGASASGSARSALSSGSRRGGPPPPPYGPPPVSVSGPYPLPPAPTAFESLHRSSSYSASYSASRSSAYATPESSARTSDFGSVYDSMSHGGSARSATPDLKSVYENAPALELQANQATTKRKKSAYAAAFDAFAPADGHHASAPSGLAPAEKPAAAPSLDPLQVFSSARHGRHKNVEESLAAGFDPAFEDQYGNTLFHIACQNGNKRIAKLAIKYGGDMDAQNFKGNTGLHFLFAYGYPEIGEYFIEKGANEFIENEFGKHVRSGIR